MLNHVLVQFFIIYGLCLVQYSECQRKNACRSLEDYRTIQKNPNCWHDPDVGATPQEIVTRHGYPFESYQIQTEDGYLNYLFRVPHNGTDDKRKYRIPILLHHGLGVDSTSWLLNGQESFVFYLSNRGYDVWLANARGTKYADQHITYTVYDPQYWNFSFHEIGLYDLPALIDFIAKKTGQKGELTYIGHSMGTTVSYVYASLKPDHAAANIKSLISLGPAAYQDNVNVIFKTFAPFRFIPRTILTSLGIYGFGRNVQFGHSLIQQLCTQYPFIIFCTTFLNTIFGRNEKENNVDAASVFFSTSPSGFSLKTSLHYAQILSKHRRFQFFDYGPENNTKLYGSSVPPEYPIDKIKVPVHLFYGSRDLATTGRDAYHLFEKLKTEKTIMQVFDFEHLNFLTPKHPSKVYELLLKTIRKHYNENVMDSG